jgi:hypothetical protein
VKVHTSEQVKELIVALADETDANGKHVTPFTYAETYHEMYAELMARDKPILRFRQQTDLLSLTGRLWPLEEFLQSLGFVKIPDEMIITASGAAENGGLDAVLADVRVLTKTYGWQLVEA